MNDLERVLCWRQGSDADHPNHILIPGSQHAWRGWLPSREQLLVSLGWFVPKGPSPSPSASPITSGDFLCSLRAQNTQEELGCSELSSMDVYWLPAMDFPPCYMPVVRVGRGHGDMVEHGRAVRGRGWAPAPQPPLLLSDSRRGHPRAVSAHSIK